MKHYEVIGPVEYVENGWKAEYVIVEAETEEEAVVEGSKELGTLDITVGLAECEHGVCWVCDENCSECDAIKYGEV